MKISLNKIFISTILLSTIASLSSCIPYYTPNENVDVEQPHITVTYKNYDNLEATYLANPIPNVDITINNGEEFHHQVHVNPGFDVGLIQVFANDKKLGLLADPTPYDPLVKQTISFGVDSIKEHINFVVDFSKCFVVENTVIVPSEVEGEITYASVIERNENTIINNELLDTLTINPLDIRQAHLPYGKTHLFFIKTNNPIAEIPLYIESYDTKLTLLKDPNDSSKNYMYKHSYVYSFSGIEYNK